MTDMNGFNPNKKMGPHFTPNQKSKHPNPTADSSPSAAGPSNPQADLQMDPNQVLDLLAVQGQANRISPKFTGASNGIERSIQAFSTAISPERHSLMSRMLEQTFQKEFGKKPSPALLQEILDHYLVGEPVIQQG